MGSSFLWPSFLWPSFLWPSFLWPSLARADTPGVTATEIKIGNINALSGPASAYGIISHTIDAYFKMVNDQGGINGNKINFIFYDDGYAPPRAMEQARRLVEQDEVAFLFNTLGTPSNSAIERYMNQKKVPQLFVASGADKWGDYQHFPWTIGFQPSYRTEAQIYAKHMARVAPAAKLAIIYQNDDFGKDYLAGVRDVLGDKFDQVVVKTASYEVTDPTLDSQITALQASGADALITGATPKFAAQVIRKVFDLNWKPLHFISNVSVSVASVIKPVGMEKAVGILTGGYLKDATDSRWKDDAGVRAWRDFMAKYFADGDTTDANTLFGYAAAATMTQALRQCDGDFSRQRVMKEATNLHDFDPGVMVPGVKINTSPTNYHPIRQMQLARWSGEHWEYFGNVISDAGF
jgi:branched-chain amino acid transport system substrate-binding protein